MSVENQTQSDPVVAAPVVTPAPVAPAPAPQIKSGSVKPSTVTPVAKTATPAEVMAVKEQKQVMSSGISISKELSSLIERIAATKNVPAINAINDIKQYIVDMNPGRTMTTVDGSRNQVILFRAIRSIIEFTGSDFQIAFATLLRFFDEYKNGVFGERYVFRFMESVSLSPEERRAYERIVTLLKITSSAQGRKEALRQVNFQKILQYSFTEEGKQKVLGFFNV